MTKSELPVNGCVSQALLLKKTVLCWQVKTPKLQSVSVLFKFVNPCLLLCLLFYLHLFLTFFWRFSLASLSEPAQLFERVSDVTHILAEKEFARHAQYGSFIFWRHLCIPPHCTPFQAARVGGRKFKEVLSNDFFLVLIAYIGYGSCATMRSMSFGFEKESKAC